MTDLFKGILGFAPSGGFDQELRDHLATTTHMQGVICHFALIVSLQLGRNVSIKIMSIEKSFLVFTFKLQHAFTRSAVFHVEWPVLMRTQSLGIQTGSGSVRESQGKE